jgi:RND family efflux transporter MFP subunit
VRVAEVRNATRPVGLHFRGRLEPIREADVVSRLAGRLTAVRFKIGDTVQAGALVATVYSGELAQRTGELEAGLVAAQKDVKEQENRFAAAAKHFEKSRELYKQDLIARRDVDQAEMAAATAKAQLELGRAQIAQQDAMLAQARKLQSLTQLVAPIGGVVIRRDSDPGATVNESKSILTIAQLDPLKLVAELPASYADQIGAGFPVRIASVESPALMRQGEVARVESKFENQQPVLQLEIRVANGDRAFRPGAAIDAILNLERHEEILLIPRAAVQLVADKRFVYKIANGRAARYEVKIDDEANDPVVIRDGLKAGDAVILDWTEAVTEGARVRGANSREKSARP